ncbi:MAG: hypothetical protein WAV18_32465 [Roseiarcus sp.]
MKRPPKELAPEVRQTEEPYEPIWMTGAAALEHLAGTYEDPQNAFEHLRRAILEGRIVGRWCGKEREREFWTSRGISSGSGEEFVPRVDDTWRDKFAYAEPASVSLKEFGEQSELHRESVRQVFRIRRGGAAPRPQTTARQMNDVRADRFAADFIKATKQKGGEPTIADLVKSASDAGWRGGREEMRAAFRKIQGVNFKGRGRPRKSPTKFAEK